MTTSIPVDHLAPDPGAITAAADILENGGVLAFPTETVYGLGALEGDENACAKLRKLKERPGDKPFTLLIADSQETIRRCDQLPIAAGRPARN